MKRRNMERWMINRLRRLDFTKNRTDRQNERAAQLASLIQEIWSKRAAGKP